MARESQESIAAWSRASGAVLCASTQSAAINTRYAELVTEWLGPHRTGFLVARAAETAVALILLAELRGFTLADPVVPTATASWWFDCASKNVSRIIRGAQSGNWSDVDCRLQATMNCLAGIAECAGHDLGIAIDRTMAVNRRVSANTQARAVS